MDEAAARALEKALERKSRQVAILERVAVQLIGTLELEPLLKTVLALMDEAFAFNHAMVLLHDAPRGVLTVAASHGYADTGIGAEVKVGDGVIGVVAKRKKLMRMGAVQRQRTYVSAAGAQLRSEGGADTPAVALPGLADAMSVVAIPLLVRDELVGVFAVESE